MTVKEFYVQMIQVLLERILVEAPNADSFDDEYLEMVSQGVEGIRRELKDAVNQR